MAVVGARICGGKLGLFIELSGQEAACQGYPRENADIVLFSQREEGVGRAQAEHIENHFNNRSVIVERFNAFFGPFNADAIMPNLTGFLQGIQCKESFRLIVDLHGRAV